MAYIDREKVLNICEEHYQHCLEMHDYCGDTTADNIKEDIEKLPTADVVEVVRCKECKHYETSDWDGEILCGCNHPSGLKDVEPNAHCSYGERKE